MMSKNIHALLSRDEMDSLLTGVFNPKGEASKISLPTKDVSRTRPSKKILSSLEARFLLSDFGVFS